MKNTPIKSARFFEPLNLEADTRVKARSVSFLQRFCERAFWLVVDERREEAQKICDLFSPLGYAGKASLWRPIERVHALEAVLNDGQAAFEKEVADVVAASEEEALFHHERLQADMTTPVDFDQGDLRSEAGARLERVMTLVVLHALGGGALSVENTMVLCEEQAIRLRKIGEEI